MRRISIRGIFKCTSLRSRWNRMQKDPRFLQKFTFRELGAIWTSVSRNIEVTVLLVEARVKASTLAPEKTKLWKYGRKIVSSRGKFFAKFANISRYFFVNAYVQLVPPTRGFHFFFLCRKYSQTDVQRCTWNFRFYRPRRCKLSSGDLFATFIRSLRVIRIVVYIYHSFVARN